MASSSIKPVLVAADDQGRICDLPDLAMICRQGSEFSLPRPDELMPLPEGSQLFLLPGRHAVGLDYDTGQVEALEELAVAARVPAGFIVTGHSAYHSGPDAPALPDLVYAAVGFANERFYVCARGLAATAEPETPPTPGMLHKRTATLAAACPDNRLAAFLSAPGGTNPAGSGSNEVQLPLGGLDTNPSIKRPLGCPPAPQTALPPFTPTAREYAEVMLHYAAQALSAPVFVLGQPGGQEPLLHTALLCQAIRLFKEAGGKGGIQLVSSAAQPEAVAAFADAGADRLIVFMTGFSVACYTALHTPGGPGEPGEPGGYPLNAVWQSITLARERGLYTCLRLPFAPGVSDTEHEVQALLDRLEKTPVNGIMLENLAADPELLLQALHGVDMGPRLGFANFKKRLQRSCPGCRIGPVLEA